jgi:hypothetical protein
MICLTGDIHHGSLRTGNQLHSDVSEVELAGRFLDILRGSGVKATYFVSGKTFAEEWPVLRPICEDPSVEIGGHTYSCFEPVLFHRASKKLLGSYNGPRAWQRWDVTRTIDIVRQKTGRTIRAWRNHMYMHQGATDEVLAEAGIRICSDVVSATASGPYFRRSDLLEIPINVIPDHEHLYHAERTPEWVRAWQARYRWSDAFGSASYRVDEWAEIVLDQLRRNEERKALSTVIIHPITMYLCDGFVSVRKIVDYIASRPTCHVSEVEASARIRTAQALEAWS